MSDFVKTSNEKISDTQEKIFIFPKEKRYIMVTDEESGQIKGCFPLKSKNLGTGWIALYQNPSLWLAQQDLTGEQYKVMLVLFNKLDFNNYLRIALKEISELLNMQVANVSRAMKKLKELEIIIEGPPAGKFKTYRLNPFIAHKGSDRRDTVKDFNSALESKNEKNS
ncbi:MAG: replication/maintenance protein RepL, partial [Selenomonadaceae bacterium]|nr:replication/maintenance protein RepL [Selenomonadaceae bacterium]MBQ6004728.1 replication/maintenance protein RepL [Selenomonadaceae bacterium]